MAAPSLRPTETSLILYRIAGLLTGTATATGSGDAALSGARASYVASLTAILAEVSPTGGVFAQLLPQTVPGRAVLVRAGIVPGGLRTNPAREQTGYLTVPPLQVMCLVDPDTGEDNADPYRTLDAMQTACFLCLDGQRIGWPGRAASAMEMSRRTEPTPPERYDDRLLFSTAEYRAAVYSLATA